jgi:hypothetical protein
MANDADVLVRAGANLWRGRAAVGGWLTLTRERLSFQAHALSIQTSPLDVAVKEIVDVRKYRSYGFIPNGLAVTMASVSRTGLSSASGTASSPLSKV